ncbi:hypothetical protein L6452_26752 [Arctium lappa]|uniref:Uncharacterized protein n=1 Tax=Arctium lappa TaxID=4217 RepID=A0ACB8ZV85_ARCLA|nr:hypothetical protein L6452_26752 [Arctium lappa]
MRRRFSFIAIVDPNKNSDCNRNRNKDNIIHNKDLRKAMVEWRWWEAEAILKKAATEVISNEAEAIRKIPKKAATEAISNVSEAIWKNPEKAATEAIINGSKIFWKNPEKTTTEAINNRARAIRKFPEIAVTEDSYGGRSIMESAREGMNNKAKVILRKAKKAVTEAINNDGNTMLHLAVRIGQDYFVEKLLDFKDDGKEIEKQNSDGRTMFHISAIVGNKHAAELLVKKRKELLGISDHKAYVPLLNAYYNMQLDTFVYLMEAAEIR